MTIEFKVVPNRCDCHPETCSCNPWAVVDQTGKKYATMYKEDDAKSIAEILNERVQEGLLNGD